MPKCHLFFFFGVQFSPFFDVDEVVAGWGVRADISRPVLSGERAVFEGLRPGAPGVFEEDASVLLSAI